MSKKLSAYQKLKKEIEELKKLSAYQKLKKEIEELNDAISVLNSDIRTIIRNPESIEGVHIIKMHSMKFDMEDQIWAGNSLISKITGE
jgi:predicted  nucleic acid-binding Zn-ribbon protein